MNNVKILQAVADIERWAGEAYYTPDTDPKVCPEGDEIYKALQVIKSEMDVELIPLSRNEREIIALWMDTAMCHAPKSPDEVMCLAEVKAIKEKML